ncbi:hypothetical protein [Caminibacter pacificus]
MIVGIDLGGKRGDKTRIVECEIINDKLKINSIHKNAINYLQNIKSPAVIGIDAPFSVPAKLIKTNEEKIEIVGNESHSINNPYLYDNSARLIYKYTKIIPLAPCATYIGYLTAYMQEIQDNCKHIEFVKTPENIEINGIKAIEVYPSALKKILKKDIQEYFEDDLSRFKDKDLIDACFCALNVFLVLKYGFVKEEWEFKNSFIYLPKLEFV